MIHTFPVGVSSSGRELFMKDLRMYTVGVSNCLVSTIALNVEPQLANHCLRSLSEIQQQLILALGQ